MPRKKIRIAEAQDKNRRGGQDKEANQAIADAVGKEGFDTPRQQFIFTRQPNMPAYVLAAIWGVSQRAIEIQKTRATKNGDSWQDARETHLRQVASGITKATREQAKEDTEDLTSNLVAINGAFLVKITGALGQAQKASDIAALVRAYKSVIEIYDKLSGRQAQSEVFDGRRAENDYMVSLIQHYIDDPEVARRFAHAMQHRRAMIGVDANIAYRDQIDGVYRAGAVVQDAEAAVDEVRAGHANQRRKFVD